MTDDSVTIIIPLKHLWAQHEKWINWLKPTNQKLKLGAENVL